MLRLFTSTESGSSGLFVYLILGPHRARAGVQCSLCTPLSEALEVWGGHLRLNFGFPDCWNNIRFFIGMLWVCYSQGRILKANLSWNQTQAKFCRLIANLSVILLQLKLIKLKLEVRKSNFQCKKL